MYNRFLLFSNLYHDVAYLLHVVRLERPVFASGRMNRSSLGGEAVSGTSSTCSFAWDILGLSSGSKKASVLPDPVVEVSITSFPLALVTLVHEDAFIGFPICAHEGFLNSFIVNFRKWRLTEPCVVA